MTDDIPPHMFKLYPYQQAMIDAILHGGGKPVKSPHADLYPDDVSIIIGLDYGGNDLGIQTTFLRHEDRLMVLDIKTIENEIKGKKMSLSIIDDEAEPTESPSKVHKGRAVHHGKTAPERLKQSRNAKQAQIDKFWAARNKRK